MDVRRIWTRRSYQGAWICRPHPAELRARYNRIVMDVYEELVRLRNLGQKCALATIVEVRGSIPSYESAKLLVREDGSMAGTIGGGCVEAEVWNAAREVIETEKPKHLTFNLGQDAAYDNGLICGGQLDVFVEPVLPVPHAFIFGAGHISKSLSKVATLAGFATVVIDNRETLRQPRTLSGSGRCSRRGVRRSLSQAAHQRNQLHDHRDARPSRRHAGAAAGDRHAGALYRHDRQQAQSAQRDPRTGKGRHSARSVRADPRSHGPGYRRHFSGGDRHFGGGGNDRGAPQRGFQLALAFAVGVCRRIAADRTRQVSCRTERRWLILAAGESRRMGSPKALLTYRGETFLDRADAACSPRDARR